MEDALDGLFGPTPEQIRQSQMLAMQKQALDTAQLQPWQQVRYGMMTAGSQLGDALAQAFGGKNIAVERAKAVQGPLSDASTDLSTSQGLLDAADKMRAIDPVMALRLALKGKEMQKQESASALAADRNAREEQRLQHQITSEFDFRKFQIEEGFRQRAADREEKARQADQAAENARLTTQERIAAQREAASLRAQIARDSQAVQLQIAQMHADAKKAAGTAQAAPTLTQIVDPTDPKRMITINAREYEGGGIGSKGVIGLAGKAPKTDEEQKLSAGMDDMNKLLDDIGTAFGQLKQTGGITSTDKGAMGNLTAWAKSTGAGQVAGRAVGSRDQALRDSISSSRLRLLSAFKAATGMGQKAIDSNSELKMWLDSLGSLESSYEANMSILNSLRGFVANRQKSKAAEAPDSGATPPPPPGMTVDK